MRKFLVLFIGAVLAISLCSCDFSDTASGGTASKAPTTTPAAAAKADDGNKVMDTEGDIGDYHLKIVSAKKGKDYSKKDVLIVTYQWTNNGDDEQMFSTAFSISAYQNGVECDDITMVDGVDTQQSLSKIKPGATMELQDAYILDGDSDVSIEVGPWISIGESSKVTKTFSVK